MLPFVVVDDEEVFGGCGFFGDLLRDVLVDNHLAESVIPDLDKGNRLWIFFNVKRPASLSAIHNLDGVPTFRQVYLIS